ncbi:hypothetical protein Q9R19_02185 [Microbacterium sp. ARD32]|uniref:hypothetical protein n=1 Tax=Microbacterium sp. ARD32 TaxID=2962577 RepID=UPI002881DD95|nr:hypothetical protein [Microbacterium sp. ARD32]MDT0156426.1 hypothetical protein [Microbacterium sp. ARD32]
MIGAAAVAVGFAIAWLVSPQASASSPPEMTDAQQKAQREAAASGDVDADSLIFMGAEHGAWTWRATEGDEACLVLVYDGQRSIACGDPETGAFGSGVISAGLSTDDDETTVSVTASMIRTLEDEWAVVVDRWQSERDDDSWTQQYSPEELQLVRVLQDAGFDGQQLQLVVQDGDYPVWASNEQQDCLMIVDPANLQLMQSCVPGDSSERASLIFRDATYVLNWSELRGPVVTIIRNPKAVTRLSCDTATGDCTSIDDKTGDVG